MTSSEGMGEQKVAVVIFNLGGPDSPEAVRPFLFNLFNDPAILRVPNPMRWLLARLISWRRAPLSQEIYQQVGGRSTLLAATNDQASALRARLQSQGASAEVFVFMRYGIRWLRKR